MIGCAAGKVVGKIHIENVDESGSHALFQDVECPNFEISLRVLTVALEEQHLSGVSVIYDVLQYAFWELEY